MNDAETLQVIWDALKHLKIDPINQLKPFSFQLMNGVWRFSNPLSTNPDRQYFSEVLFKGRDRHEKALMNALGTPPSVQTNDYSKRAIISGAFHRIYSVYKSICLHQLIITCKLSFCSEFAGLVISMLNHYDFHYEVIFTKSEKSQFNHIFVVVNRPKDKNIRDVKSWGNSAYVLDLWNDTFICAGTANLNTVNNLFYSNNPEIIKQWEWSVYFDSREIEHYFESFKSIIPSTMTRYLNKAMTDSYNTITPHIGGFLSRLSKRRKIDNCFPMANITVANLCFSCFKTHHKALKACSRCHRTYYCDQHCQTLHWKREHKAFCRA